VTFLLLTTIDRGIPTSLLRSTTNIVHLVQRMALATTPTSTRIPTPTIRTRQSTRSSTALLPRSRARTSQASETSEWDRSMPEAARRRWTDRMRAARESRERTTDSRVRTLRCRGRRHLPITEQCWFYLAAWMWESFVMVIMMMDILLFLLWAAETFILSWHINRSLDVGPLRADAYVDSSKKYHQGLCCTPAALYIMLYLTLLQPKFLQLDCRKTRSNSIAYYCGHVHSLMERFGKSNLWYFRKIFKKTYRTSSTHRLN